LLLSHGLPYRPSPLIVGEVVMQAVWAGLNVALGIKFYTCTE